MLKKMKQSIQRMPCAAYILVKNTLILCDIILFCSLCLFLSSEGAVESYERTKLAWLTLEMPAGLLLIAFLALIFILDRR